MSNLNNINISVTKQNKKGKIISFNKTITTLDSLKDIINKQAGILAIYDTDNKTVLFQSMHKDKLLTNAGSWAYLEKINK